MEDYWKKCQTKFQDNFQFLLLITIFVLLIFSSVDSFQKKVNKKKSMKETEKIAKIK